MQGKQAIKYFIANRTATAGSVYFITWLVVSIFAYLLIPDNSPNAGIQHLEITKTAPLSRIPMLSLVSTQADTHASFFSVLFFGKTSNIRKIPLKKEAVLFQRDTLYYTHYSGEEGRVFLPLESYYHISTQTFWLGTDTFGRDVLSRLVLGARVSITIGIMATFISLLIGLVVGLCAGFFGGMTDKILMAIISVIWSVPTLLLAIVLGFVMGMGFWQLKLAIGLTNWVDIARLVRGMVIKLKGLPFIEATHSLGLGRTRIMVRHILPNVVSALIIMAVSGFGSAILVESGLSFLGLGVGLEVPTWGRMVYEGYPFLVMENGKWLAIIPGIALILLVVSIHLIGTGLRDTFSKTLL